MLEGACSASRENDGRSWRRLAVGSGRDSRCFRQKRCARHGHSGRPGDHARSFRIDIWISGATIKTLNFGVDLFLGYRG